MDMLNELTFDELRNEQIKYLKKQAEQNTAFLDGDGFLYENDYLYTNENLMPKEQKKKSTSFVFLIQLFVSLSVFFLYLCRFYEILPVNQELDRIIRYFLSVIN